MKLHLPVSLFAAVMAAISSMPTFADVTVKIGGEDQGGSWWEQYEAAAGYIIDEDMEITLSGTDGQLTLPTDKSFAQRGDITIRITDGACLKGDVHDDDDGITYQFGKLGTYGSKYTPTKKEYTANLIIDGGSASLSSGGRGFYNSVVFGEIGVGKEYDDVRLHVNIDVKHGNLDIAADSASCASHLTGSGQADLTVTVGAGGTINFSAYEDECYLHDASVLPNMGYNSTSATLTIQDGGILNLGVACFGYYRETTEEYCQLTVEVIGKESHLNLHGGNIGLVSTSGAFILSPGLKEVTGNIKIDGGCLTMSDNSIRGGGTFSPSIAYADGKGTETMNMTICHGGTVDMQTGKIGYARTTPEDDASTITLNLKLEDTSSLTMGSGTIAGAEGDNSHVHAKITMTGDSRFTMAGGAIGKGKGADLTINMEGGSFTASAGSIGKGAASCELNLKGGSFTVEEGASFTGNINVHSGSLSLAEGSYKSTDGKHVSIQLDNPAGADLGGLDASLIKEDLSISAAGATLRGLKAGSTLTLGGEGSAANVITVGSGSAALTNGGTSSDSGEKNKIIEFQEGSGTIKLADGCTVTLNFGEDEFLGELSGKENIEIQVYLTNAELSADDDVMKHFELGAGWGLSVKSYTVTADGGILTLTGNTTGVANLDGTQSDFTGVSDADKVIVTGDTTLTSTAEQGGTLKRLQGEHNLTVKGEGEVELYNDGDLFNADGNTTFGGKLATEKGVTLKKTGEDSLTLGSLQAEGDVTVEEGKLVLTGDDNSIGGTLTLGEGGTLEVGQDGQLTLSGSVDGKGTGNLTGNGTVILDGDIEFGNVRLGEDLTIQMGEHCGSVDFGNSEVTLSELKGESVKGNVTVTGPGEFSGSFDGKLTVRGEQNLTNKGNGNCELVVEGQRGQASLAPGSTYGSVTNGGDPNGDMKGGKLVIAADENGSKAGAGITVHKDIIFRNGAETNFVLNMSDPNLWGAGEHDATMLTTTQTIWIEPETSFVIDGLEETLHEAKGDLRNVIILHGTTIENKNYKPSNTNSIGFFALVRTDEAPALLAEGSKTIVNAKVDLGFTLNQLYENVQLWRMDNGDVGFDADRRTDSKYASYAKTTNGKTGLNLLWQNYNRNNGNVSQEEQSIIQELERLSGSNNAAEASRVMAAVAGSTLTSLSAAQSAALRNQMGRVRDHALQAGRLRCAGNADEATAQQRPCKNSHVWVEGTSFFSEQHSVGDESGYRLNSWGGAVGIDAQVDAHWSVGVSLSASYGDLEARAADYAKGDLDTYTVSFWSQAKNGRWGNTLLFTLGTNEADLKRTVNYGAGSYTATSNTSGSSLGAMWEVTYDLHPVKDNKSNILQPLFNVAVMHTSMDGFSEGNAGNVGLTTEKQTRDTVTLGLGLRWLAAINSAKAVNRTVSTEVHANVAQDLGDRRSVANVALLADPSYTQNVYGSKAGSTAFQFGAGVNVPMTPNSQIYVNAGGELREHANAWNAALGVRMGF